jgi:hypothetical protein
MKKLLAFLFLFSITSINVSCKKEQSETSTSSEKSTAVKCPSCGSESLSSLEPGGRILECNACGVAFDKP